MAGKIMGMSTPPITPQTILEQAAVRQARNTASDPLHVLYREYELMPSGRGRQQAGSTAGRVGNRRVVRQAGVGNRRVIRQAGFGNRFQQQAGSQAGRVRQQTGNRITGTRLGKPKHELASAGWRTLA
ncbi:hypothetical protein N1851_000021 [Merluccius polli]|uniref:Uncharacterized protein n=1 Tax=Merluccius polli TaxID=89951 RepID=A0AA47NDM0_MERPO|nr:hypothetical protein N1851_000021 [Merluccius polli]